ncbi:hypothetical protein BP5796_06207 [Coleophoma crateriformis]|uniref:Alpha/beta hydrolase fold-3 domain-containing protein n=1 Tax=Coleophoma crateriformis TaxID=565419 RepID=A0A3D8RWF8_9HELO|nr:hypothetical protein BP5796_06207 [Coleophoma crateriformis]
MVLDLFAGAHLVGPAMTRTIVASLTKKMGNEGRATDDPGYKETLDLMRRFIDFTAVNTVEDVQHVTTAWMPAPPSVLVTGVEIPSDFYSIAAEHISANLGPVNLNRVGKTWWQWRRPGSVVRAEWVEMKSDYLERKANGDEGKKVMFYIHGGAYFFGGISHGPQIQRHARKDPSHIVIAGDSAGGGLCVALLILLRDQGLPLPAGASLISPWVDLTHSFPSIILHTDFDYVPAHGFHAKPSLSWPPPSTQEMKSLNWPTHPGAEPDHEIEIDGEKVVLTDQFQMYAQNTHLQIPLVSGICAASLGGLCPIQVIAGGGEVLRDEQIYLAHKAADPKSYSPSAEILANNGQTEADVHKYPPTDVQLLIFDDCPHAAPTLGHTRGAKYQYRSIAQFAAWALARAQKTDIEIEDFDDDATSNGEMGTASFGQVGRAGDPLEPFVDHMIRHRVDRFGYLFPLKPPSGLRACNFPASEIGWPKAAALKGYFKYKAEQEKKFGSLLKKAHEQRQKNAKTGYIKFPDGEVPPPSALAGRRVLGQEVEREKERGRLGKGIVGLLFGRFDEAPVSASRKTESANNPRRKTVLYQPNQLDSFNPVQADTQPFTMKPVRRYTKALPTPPVPPMAESNRSQAGPSTGIQRRMTEPGFYEQNTYEVRRPTSSDQRNSTPYEDEEAYEAGDIEDIWDSYREDPPTPTQPEASSRSEWRRTAIYHSAAFDDLESLDTMVDWDGPITSASPQSDISMRKQWRMTAQYKYGDDEDAVKGDFDSEEPPPAYEDSTRASRFIKPLK